MRRYAEPAPRSLRLSWLCLVPLALAACASPTAGLPKDPGHNTAHGPGLDLAGFVQAEEDLAPETKLDLASSVAPADMATSSLADMSMATGTCAGGVTYAGSCSGYKLTYCDTSTNKVVTSDCSKGGFDCTVDGTGDADCRDPVLGCGPVTSGGLCYGNTLKYCKSSKIVVVDCGFLYTCVDSGGYADCY